MTAESESLFTYLPYESFETVRDPDFNPTFDINPEPANVSICNGDPFCEYDITITGDREVGMATLSAVADIQKVVEKSAPGMCVYVCFYVSHQKSVTIESCKSTPTDPPTPCIII